MKVIDSNSRRRPFMTERTHARLRHDHATWHPEHVTEALRVVQKKQVGGLPFPDRSKFDSASIIEEAIQRSYEYSAQVAANGNHVVVFDMGYEIGFDERAKRRTSGVTVILRPTGEVVTVHPGTPWAEEAP